MTIIKPEQRTTLAVIAILVMIVLAACAWFISIGVHVAGSKNAGAYGYASLVFLGIAVAL